MTAYYNEIDPFAAQWLRNLISAGHIAPGDVDERSIEDVKPGDLRGYVQCHFFAGIGVWSYALRRAGWDDSKPVWTGSCPCQPFSAAGKGTGFADERHLWPAWHWLIQECRPTVIVGEQVASKDAEPWVDLVQADLEAGDYAFGAVAFPSAGVGAPHIRDRIYWVGDADSTRLERHARNDSAAEREGPGRSTAQTGIPSRMADTASQRRRWRPTDTSWAPGRTGIEINCIDGRVGYSESKRCGETRKLGAGPAQRPADASATNSGMADADQERHERGEGVGWKAQRWAEHPSNVSRPGPVNGFWEDADWLLCRDGKWRPVEPGSFPLAYGDPTRVGRLRAYGNAINAKAAQTFIAAYLECRL